MTQSLMYSSQLSYVNDSDGQINERIRSPLYHIQKEPVDVSRAGACGTRRGGRLRCVL